MYDPAIGRFNRIDRFADKYYPLSPYSFTANNPIKYVDINGDSIYIYSQKDKQSILYHEGNLYWAGTGKTYDGKAYNKKGNLTGFVKQASGALDNIRTGGAAGKELIDYFQNASFKDIRIENGTSNGERSGLISWNPNERNSSIPNQDGSFGRDPFIGLAHEIGHSWDRWENGSANTNSTWYTAADGTNVTQSEKVATWWENRIRAENNVGLREFYSFTNSNGRMQGDAAGRLLIQGTRYSQHNNIFGQQRQIVVGPFGIILNTPYRY
jgi:hypothetical protein